MNEPNASGCEVVLVRHGETEWNAQGRMQGHTDVGLNARGEQQAETACETLQLEGISGFYSSDLARTRQTAQPFARRYGQEPHLVEGLREWHLGVFQGLTIAEIKERLPDDFAHRTGVGR